MSYQDEICALREKLRELEQTNQDLLADMNQLVGAAKVSKADQEKFRFIAQYWDQLPLVDLMCIAVRRKGKQASP
ncbi:hypothetical protein SAMN05421823_102544 [Catalinimonas alkaloidigena]|uniref:Uncharacterized protein n=1 Tax=Catalinimonas alkaloidigena TaxID=1075417 RepID=A0A1G9B822_9BACT|nr:hypothetical protein [Catalinimonas alkaloidigena]SDK35702.1 hypothetical protein SAMN05421823_102544 [Catalinimonas alkaloidigena]